MTDKFIPGQTYKDREGREYIFVGYAPNAHVMDRAVFTRGSYLASRCEDGKAHYREFDIVRTKDVWVNVYATAEVTTGVTCSFKTYASEEEAAAWGRNRNNYLFSQKITVTI